MAALPRRGRVVALFTDLVVREDLMQLFGFPDLGGKRMAPAADLCSGVGAKAFLGYSGRAWARRGSRRALRLGDWNAVKVAKASAQRSRSVWCFESQDKAPGVMAMPALLAEAHGEVRGGRVIEPASTQTSPRRPANQSASQGACRRLPIWVMGGDAGGRCGQSRPKRRPVGDTPQC